MSLSTLKELINPNWARRRGVPPMDTGLRPNLRLDEAAELLPSSEFEPDDVVVTDAGEVVFSSENQVLALRGDDVVRVAELDGRVAALAVRSEEILAAVDGVGIVSVTSSKEVCSAASVTSRVTDLTVAPDGSLLVTVGSTTELDWARALVTGDRSGAIVRVDGPRAEVVAEGLAWPSGIEASAGEVLVSLSFDHRVETRPVDALGRPGKALIANLPVYPGRISGRWFAAPYIRNRVTEMLLDEPEVLAEMTDTISPAEWFVPRLRGGSPFTETMQMGQLRVLGVVKSWAPARSCGLVFRVDGAGRVAESAHARVDSARHGVTGVAVREGRVLAAARGYGNLLEGRA
ncbi:hypothetical protein [Amycolatopsis regifaucium]|uniref:Strictosidine synthase conserved region domain-containing protein n=1 Tax=Amycolatopsis regifaucium TaxID=546365 RepID=A0A154MF78_9PSEU|nr:hypothetical protein [Amycolatopsis regifaucium]KZB83135.1 hypothetical protein AVL48_36570 [Amycolatopsis regifaucium]OKA03210.1 hypothetical protein ATP06_0237430 [Amycolatopsis regifaucium]SFJ47009.1 hypothetical protein SAMN04489731_12234 [Amycolatopsis regifaucium]